MNSIGRTIQCLRKAKGVTQEKMAQQIGVSFQAISKWENEYTLPDIMLLPAIADYFGVSIDDLFQFKANILTSKERLISFMLKNGILRFSSSAEDEKQEYRINSERFTTNMQLNAIGEEFAEILLDERVAFDAIMGVAYHGIGFATSTAMALRSRYACTTHFCYDRIEPDCRGRTICGYTPCDGDRIVIVNDVIANGKETDKHIARLLDCAKVEIAAILVVAEIRSELEGRRRLEEKYHTRVYSLVTDEDIQSVLKKGIRP